MNSEPLSESMALSAKGRAARMSSSAAWTRACPLPEHRSRLHPRRVNVGQIQRVQELAHRAVPRVRDQIDLRRARPLHIPMIGLDRDLVLEERARLRSAVDAPSHPTLARRQASIHLTRADLLKLAFSRARNAEPSLRPRQPER